MNIELTLEDYFKELELMEKHYGLEEELYPFINMLLRMGRNEINFSIRNVAKGVKCDNEKGRKLLYGCVGFPDIAILGKDFDKKSEDEKNMKKIFGCVEAKALDKKLPVKLGGSVEIKDKYIFIIKPSSGNANYRYERKLEANDVEKIVVKLSFSEIKLGCEEKTISIQKAEKDELKILVSDKENILEKFAEWTCIKNQGLKNAMTLQNVLKGSAYIIISRTPVIYVGEESFELCNYDGTLTAEGQLFGELFWYGKVVYTNGLEWKYFEIKNCKDAEGKDVNLRYVLYKHCIEGDTEWYDLIKDEKLKVEIECESICDLTADYNAYKEIVNGDSHHRIMLCNKEEKSELVSEEWKKLTERLSVIEWSSGM